MELRSSFEEARTMSQRQASGKQSRVALDSGPRPRDKAE
jgi:hypothetical protein